LAKPGKNRVLAQIGHRGIFSSHIEKYSYKGIRKYKDNKYKLQLLIDMPIMRRWLSIYAESQVYCCIAYRKETEVMQTVQKINECPTRLNGFDTEDDGTWEDWYHYQHEGKAQVVDLMSTPEHQDVLEYTILLSDKLHLKQPILFRLLVSDDGMRLLSINQDELEGEGNPKIRQAIASVWDTPSDTWRWQEGEIPEEEIKS
jgi:hypothetical protein